MTEKEARLTIISSNQTHDHVLESTNLNILILRVQQDIHHLNLQ